MPPDLMTIFGRNLDDVNFALRKMDEIYGEGWNPKSVYQKELAMREIERMVLLQSNERGK